MPGQGRLGDKAQSQGAGDAHGCPGCPHSTLGPAISGSPNVNVNGRPALRVDDAGMHAACCGPNQWTAVAGAPTVFINGKAAFRVGDASRHCGGSGKLSEGSSNVLVGDSGGGGGGGAGSNASNGANAGTGRGNPGSGDGGGTSAAGAAPSRDTRDSSVATAESRLSSSETGSEPATEHDRSAEVVFRALHHTTGAPLAGVTLLVEFPDGHRECFTTGADGTITLRSDRAGRFRVIEVRSTKRLQPTRIVRR